MIETTINNPEFNTFIKRYKSSVIILDDSELYFSELYTKSNIFTNNLLQLVDGFQSDNLDLNIISVLNVGNIDEIDHTLLDCNNLLDIIEVSPLTTDKANELSKQIGNKGKLKEESKVIDILKKRIFKAEDSEIGFK
jgi:hypothetical protein